MSDYISYLAVYGSIGTGLLYLCGFFKYGKAYKTFAVYLFLIGLIQLAQYYVGRGYLRQPNIYISHYYYLVQFVLLSLFYRYLFKRNWFLYPMVLILGYAIYGFILDPSSVYLYNIPGLVVTHALIALYAALYLFRSVSVQGDFIIANCGLLVYAISGSLVFAGMGFEHNSDIFDQGFSVLKEINKVLYLLMLLLFIGEWFKNYSILVPNEN